jgi:hypothetical protein
VQALFESGAGKSLITTDLFQKLGRDVGIFTPEVAVELYDINNRRLSTRGTLSVSFQVVGEERPEQLTQSFIVVDNITESCVLGLHPLYEHKFMFDGRERSIYRAREPDHLPFSPICVAQRKIKISARSVLVVESGGGGGELPPDIACFLYSILHKNLTGGVLYFEIEIRPVKNSNNARNCAPDVVS